MTEGRISSSTQPFRGKAKVGSWHRWLITALGKVPFSGRNHARQLIGMVHDTRTQAERGAAMRELFGWMGVNIAGYAAPALGVAYVAQQMGKLYAQHPSLGIGIAMAGEIGSSAVFGVVAVAQTALTGHLLKNLWDRRNETPETGGPVKQREPVPYDRRIADATFTVGMLTLTAATQLGPVLFD